MAEAQINELFEEAIGRCQELTDQAETTSDALESMVSTAQDLGERLAGEAEETREALQRLAEGVDRAEGALATAVDTAQASVRGLGAKAAEVQAAATASVARVKDALAELAGVRDALRGRLPQQAQEAADDVQELADRVAALQEEIGERLASATERVQELTDAVVEAHDDWLQRRKGLLAAIEQLESGVRQATTAYAGRVEDELNDERVDVLVRTLVNQELIGAHNEAIDLLGDTFEEELPEAVEGQLAPLGEAAAALGSLCAEQEDALQASVAAVHAGIDVAAAALASMAPALGAAAAVKP